MWRLQKTEALKIILKEVTTYYYREDNVIWYIEFFVTETVAFIYKKILKIHAYQWF